MISSDATDKWKSADLTYFRPQFLPSLVLMRVRYGMSILILYVFLCHIYSGDDRNSEKKAHCKVQEPVGYQANYVIKAKTWMGHSEIRCVFWWADTQNQMIDDVMTLKIRATLPSSVQCAAMEGASEGSCKEGAATCARFWFDGLTESPLQCWSSFNSLVPGYFNKFLEK